MPLFARTALLLLLSIGFVRLSAAEADDVASLRAKAEHGNALAQYNLGLAYTQGRLTAADPAEAFAWLSLASENGATGKALDSLLGNISDEQLAEGRRRLNTYRTAVSSKATTLTTHTPKLAPRGFTVDRILRPVPVPAAPPRSGRPGLRKPLHQPSPPPPPKGAAAAELAQARRDLERAQDDLVNANNELATLRASVARLEATVAEAKATEARLLAELKALRPDAVASKSAAPLPTAEKTPPVNPGSH